MLGVLQEETNATSHHVLSQEDDKNRDNCARKYIYGILPTAALMHSASLYAETNYMVSLTANKLLYGVINREPISVWCTGIFSMFID